VCYNPAALNFPMDAIGAIVVKTFFGPVVVGSAYGDRGHHRYFFRLGCVF
jgi:hypothetical protein